LALLILDEKTAHNVNVRQKTSLLKTFKYEYQRLSDLRENSRITNPTNTTTSRIPTHTPALNISAIAAQLLRFIARINIAKMDKYAFILYSSGPAKNDSKDSMPYNYIV
jgi:hypothetical protein